MRLTLLAALTSFTVLACGQPLPNIDDAAPPPLTRDADAPPEADESSDADADVLEDVPVPAVADAGTPPPPAPSPDAGPLTPGPLEEPAETLVPEPVAPETLDIEVPSDRAFADVRVSADSSRVAFVLAPAAGAYDGDLYLLDAGDHVARLVGRGASDFIMSDDGRTIAWLRPVSPGHRGTDVDLFAYDDVERTLTLLTTAPDYTLELPRGTVQIAADRAIVHQTATGALRLYEPETRTTTELSSLSVQRPVLSPDGQRVAFVGGNFQGPQLVYDRGTRETRNLGEQALAAPITRFSPDGHRLAFESFVGGQHRLEIVNLETGERVETGVGGQHFELAPSWAHAYYLRDGDRSVPFGTLCQWDFAFGTETVIDDRVRLPLTFASGERVFYRDDWDYHVVGGSPFDLRTWTPSTGVSAPVARGVHSFYLADPQGSAALVDHDGEVSVCESTLYGIDEPRTQALDGCWILGRMGDGAFVFADYADRRYTLRTWAGWEVDSVALAERAAYPAMAPGGGFLAYTTEEEAGQQVFVQRLDAEPDERETLVELADEAAIRAVSDALVVTTARKGEQFTLGIWLAR